MIKESIGKLSKRAKLRLSIAGIVGLVFLIMFGRIWLSERGERQAKTDLENAKLAAKTSRAESQRLARSLLQ